MLGSETSNIEKKKKVSNREDKIKKGEVYHQEECHCTVSWLSGHLSSFQSGHLLFQGFFLIDRNELQLSLRSRIRQRVPSIKREGKLIIYTITKHPITSHRICQLYLNVCVRDPKVQIGDEELSSRFNASSSATTSSPIEATEAVVKHVVLPLIGKLFGLQQMKENAPADFRIPLPLSFTESTRLGVGASRCSTSNTARVLSGFPKGFPPKRPLDHPIITSRLFA